MDKELFQLLIGGAIGILGAVIGAIVNHRLTLQRDRFLLEEEKRKELRQKLIEGAFSVAERHGRMQIPFSRGGSLYFPQRGLPKAESLIQEFHELLDLAESLQKATEVKEISRSFLQRLRKYVEEKNSTAEG